MVTKGQIEIISKMIDRAENDGAHNFDRLTMIYILGKATEQFDLLLENMLAADNFNFYHDYIQLPMHFDERFGIFDNRFVPRFAKPKSLTAKPTKDDIIIISDTRSSNNWVKGVVFKNNEKFSFSAKVFDDESEDAIDNGRISKLTVRRSADDKEIVNFDRGWDIYPREPDLLSMLKSLIKKLKELPYTDGRK